MNTVVRGECSCSERLLGKNIHVNINRRYVRVSVFFPPYLFTYVFIHVSIRSLVVGRILSFNGDKFCEDKAYHLPILGGATYSNTKGAVTLSFVLSTLTLFIYTYIFYLRTLHVHYRSVSLRVFNINFLYPALRQHKS